MRPLSVVLTGLALLCAVPRVRAVTLFADEFDQDTLSSTWRLTDPNGVDLLLTKRPGQLYVSNHGLQLSLKDGDVPRMALDAPAGDFTEETQVTDITGDSGNGTGPSLYIRFRSKNLLAWTYAPFRGSLGITNTAAGTFDDGNHYLPPIFLRIRRVANNYIFESKLRPDDQWVGEKQLILDEVPVEVGLAFPLTDFAPFTAALGYYHLEAPAPDGPAPLLSSLSAPTAQPGSVLTLVGQNFVPGTSRILLDGTPADGFFSTPQQGVVQVPLRVAVGSHQIEVQSGPRISSALAFTVLSTDPKFTPLAAQCLDPGDVNGDGVIDIRDAVLILRRAVGLTS